MDASGAEDGTDFRPFFDMVIGILFVLLILVAATADAEAGVVLVPLGQILTVDARGLPSVEAAPAGRLGAALSTMTGCVTLPRSPAAPCSAFARIGLDALAVTARVGALPPGAALPRDRFGDLASALLSADLLGGEPSLVGASNPAGGRVVTFASALAGPGTAATGVAGDLALDFTFE